VGRSRGDLMKIRNLGKVSLKEIEEKLTKFGLSLSGEIEEDEEEEN
jgi:DNA-directed RNA polymerase subunit alpha